MLPISCSQLKFCTRTAGRCYASSPPARVEQEEAGVAISVALHVERRLRARCAHSDVAGVRVADVSAAGRPLRRGHVGQAQRQQREHGEGYDTRCPAARGLCRSLLHLISPFLSEVRRPVKASSEHPCQRAVASRLPVHLWRKQYLPLDVIRGEGVVCLYMLFAPEPRRITRASETEPHLRIHPSIPDRRVAAAKASGQRSGEPKKRRAQIAHRRRRVRAV